MKLNAFEFALMNNAFRAASQRWIETRLMLAGRSLTGQRVLEIGCGRGVGLEILLGLGASEVVGIDVDPRMIRLAERRLAPYTRRAKVRIADVEAIPAPGATFDSVFDFGILHHVPDWPQALREVARVLTPAGTFSFEDVLRGLTTAWPIRLLLDHPQSSQFSGEEFRATLQEAGLRIAAWHQWGEWAVMGQARRSA